MILTEKEAREKWCHVVFSNSNADDDSDRCIASDCMAWRWIEDTCTPDGEGWKGYCGLAGEPEIAG